MKTKFREYVYVVSVDYPNDRAWELAMELNALLKSNTVDLPVEWKKVWQKQIDQNTTLRVYQIGN